MSSFCFRHQTQFPGFDMSPGEYQSYSMSLDEQIHLQSSLASFPLGRASSPWGVLRRNDFCSPMVVEFPEFPNTTIHLDEEDEEDEDGDTRMFDDDFREVSVRSLSNRLSSDYHEGVQYYLHYDLPLTSTQKLRDPVHRPSNLLSNILSHLDGAPPLFCFPRNSSRQKFVSRFDVTNLLFTSSPTLTPPLQIFVSDSLVAKFVKADRDRNGAVRGLDWQSPGLPLLIYGCGVKLRRDEAQEQWEMEPLAVSDPDGIMRIEVNQTKVGGRDILTVSLEFNVSSWDRSKVRSLKLPVFCLNITIQGNSPITFFSHCSKVYYMLDDGNKNREHLLMKKPSVQITRVFTVQDYDRPHVFVREDMMDCDEGYQQFGYYSAEQNANDVEEDVTIPKEESQEEEGEAMAMRSGEELIDTAPSAPELVVADENYVEEEEETGLIEGQKRMKYRLYCPRARMSWNQGLLAILGGGTFIVVLILMIIGVYKVISYSILSAELSSQEDAFSAAALSWTSTGASSFLESTSTLSNGFGTPFSTLSVDPDLEEVLSKVHPSYWTDWNVGIQASAVEFSEFRFERLKDKIKGNKQVPILYTPFSIFLNGKLAVNVSLPLIRYAFARSSDEASCLASSAGIFINDTCLWLFVLDSVCFTASADLRMIKNGCGSALDQYYLDNEEMTRIPETELGARWDNSLMENVVPEVSVLIRSENDPLLVLTEETNGTLVFSLEESLDWIWLLSIACQIPVPIILAVICCVWIRRRTDISRAKKTKEYELLNQADSFLVGEMDEFQ